MTLSKRLFFMLIGAVAAGLALLAYRIEPTVIERVDLRLKDARFIARGTASPDPRVVVVAIDPKSIKEIGRWPWPRTVVSELVSGIKSYGAVVAGLDIIFSEPDNTCAGIENDRLLGRTIFEAGNVIAGYFFRTEAQPVDERSFEHIIARRIDPVVAEGVTSTPIDEFKGIDLNVAEIGQGALDHGFFTVNADQDGIYRRAILLSMYGGDIYGSLALKTLAGYRGQPVTLSIDRHGVSELKVGDQPLPVDAAGKLRLNYYGGTATFRTLPAVDIIKKRLPPGTLNNALVLVGATEIGIFDVRATPFDPTLPGVEIHATVASNILQNSFLKYNSDTRAIEQAAIVILPVLLGVLLGFAPGTLVGLLALVLTSGGFIGFNYLTFASYLHDLTLAYPLLGIGIAYLGGESYRNLVVERKGKQLKKAFSSYVSPDLVKQIEKNPDKLVLGGEQRELSILFSDIRGFTTVSESLTPPELVTLLNEYLTPMTRIVLEEGGTLDKFIGDAVMALFNAPLDVPDHAERSCTAAVRMLGELERLNAGFAERGMHTIDIGIGINTGPAVVGNMGADIRFDYTAIGDSVNLASRLEGLNKYYGSHILVSEDTYRQVAPGRFTFREVDRVRVKGKLHPVVMFELMTRNQEILPRFLEALDIYRSMEFERAQVVFELLVAEYNDGPSRLYVGRCIEYRTDPPPAGWDGVYVAKSK